MALLDSLRDECAEHNVPLHLVLGLISLARRMTPHLPSAPAGAPAEAAREVPPPAPEPPGGDPSVYLVLGLISLRRTLLCELEPLRAAHAKERGERGAPGLDPPEPSPPAAPHGGHLLR